MGLRDDLGGFDFMDVTMYHCGWSCRNHPIIFDGVAVFKVIKFKLSIFGCNTNKEEHGKRGRESLR